MNKFSSYTKDLIKQKINEVDSLKKKSSLLKFLGEMFPDEPYIENQKYKYTKKNKKINNKYLPSSVNTLTEFGVSKLIKECIKHNTQAAFLIILSLFSGRTVEKLIDKNIVFKGKKNHDHISIKFPFKTNEFHINEKLQPFVEENLDKIELQLPDFFHGFSERNMSVSSIEDMKLLIKEINETYTLRINLGQISQYMTYWMVNNKFDTTLIAIISGRFGKKNKTNKLKSEVSGINYTRVSINKIVEIYNQYLLHLSSLAGFKYSPQRTLLPGSVGSNLVFKKSLFKRLFGYISRRIKEINASIDRDIETEFNIFTIYTLQILNLATGHRPVSDPYQTIQTINLDTQSIIICDKRSNDIIAERFIVLNNIAMKQLNNYLDYLKHLIRDCTFIDDNIKLEFSKILAGEQALFGFIENNEFKRIKPKLLTEKMEDIFPVPLNWNRHFIRTTLCEKNIHSDLIDLWMGHEGIGGYGLTEFSHLSSSNLKQIAKKINQIMRDLNILPISI
jgi:hypothetical protein